MQQLRSPLAVVRRCRTVELHLRDWAEGFTSPVRVWRHMRALQADGFTAPAIKRLGGISNREGGKGHHANLLRLLEPCGFSEFIDDVDGDGAVSKCIFPTTIFKLLFERSPKHFRWSFGAEEEGVEWFWQRLFSTPQGMQLRYSHPYLRGKTPAQLKFSLPGSLHEDAGPFTKVKSTNIISWSSCLGKGKELSCKFVAFSHIKVAGVPASCTEEAWKVFNNNLACLAEGRHPETGEYLATHSTGEPWSLIMILGCPDNETLCFWGLPSYKQVGECCGFCDGTNDGSSTPVTDLKRDSAWRPTEQMSNTKFLGRCFGCHPIRKAFYWNAQFPRIDIMHTLDHHGQTGIIIASTIHHLLWKQRVPGNTLQVRLDFINSKLKQFNEASRSSCYTNEIHMKNLFLGDGLESWLELGGPTMKAAIVRHLLPAVRSVADEYLKVEEPLDACVAVILREACHLDDILYNAGVFLTGPEKNELSVCLIDLGEHFQLARHLSQCAGTLAWHKKYKVHLAQHLHQQALLINPRFVQAYINESLIGVFTKIWRASAKGPYQSKVQGTVMLKYLVLLSLDLQL